MALYIDRLKAGGGSPSHISYGGGLLHKVVFKPSSGDGATVWERGVLEVSPDSVATGVRRCVQVRVLDRVRLRLRAGLSMDGVR